MTLRVLPTIVACLIANLGLWMLAWSHGISVVDDPMFSEPSPPLRTAGSDGAFDLQTCADCPPFVLDGREIGNPGELIAAGLGLVNIPAVLLAKGKHLRFGIYELRPPALILGVLAEWISVGLAWQAWRTYRRRATILTGQAPRGT